MNRVVFLLVALSFVIGITIGSFHSVIGQQVSIPKWVKNTALWWGQGQISDADFVKAIQWLVDNGMIQLPSTAPSSQSVSPTGTSDNTTSGSATNGTSNETSVSMQHLIFSPCPTVQLASPSTCLASFLPDPKDIGAQWTSQNGQTISANARSNPKITQHVQDDFENAQVRPEEILDITIQEWTSNVNALSAFKADEKSASNEQVFSGDPNSSDTVFAYTAKVSGQLVYHEEYVVGSVLVSIDGTGGTPQTSLGDMASVSKIMLEKMQSFKS